MIDFEKRWVQKIKKYSDYQSANKLVKKYYKEIYTFVYKQLLDEHLSLDLTQEIFIRMLQSIHHYDATKSSFRTWLYRIATNHCIDYFRSKQYQTSSQMDLVESIELEGENEVELTLEYKEEYEAVQRALAKQSKEVQQIVRLKIFLEYSFREIADVLDISESTVKTKYYKAIKQLRKEMEAYRIGTK